MTASTLVNLIRVTTATVGTGTIALGSAVVGYAGTTALVDGATYSYSIVADGPNWECGQGVYTASGGTLTRIVTSSSNGGAPINLSGSAIVNFTALAADLVPSVGKVTLTQPATGATLTLADGKTLAANNSLTLAGTDGTVMTFPAASDTLAGLGTAQTFTAANVFSAAGAASTPGLSITGAPYTGGNGTTNTPQLYLNGSASAPSTWIASGTVFGINGPPGFTGNAIDVHSNGGGSTFSVSVTGAVLASSIRSTGNLVADPNSLIAFNLRTNLSSPATNTLQLGSADAASPGAQTLQAQSVVAGTTNTSGQNFTINLSRGTGSGVGGNLVINGAPHGAAATVQNTLVPALTINGDTLASTFGGGVSITTGGLSVTGGIGGSAGIALSGGNVQIAAASLYVWSGRSFLSSGADGSLTFKNNAGTNSATLSFPSSGGATLQLGALDVAAPVAQTLGVQSVVGGTSNTAGANLTINGSRGTGTGAGGSIILQVAPAGSTGTTQNALTPVLTLDSTKKATFAGKVNMASLPTSATGLSTGDLWNNSGAMAIAA